MPSQPLESIPTELPFLIAAASGRALAAAAARAGHSSVVLDWFADSDTKSVASAAARVAQPGALGFDDETLIQQAQILAAPGACAGIVFGAGFDDRPQLLARLCAERRLYGNTPNTIAALKDPACFFRLLDEFGIGHPEVRFERPRRPKGWLAKRVGGMGGTHVVPAELQSGGSENIYYQRFEQGRSLSVVFLANGVRSHVIGFNEQWYAGRGHDNPFRYGGAVGGVRLSDALEYDIGAMLDDLVSTCGLLGLNGMDFLLNEDRVRVLEINPRPTSTFELYDADYSDGLFARHLWACRGELPEERPPALAHRGSAIVFAERSFTFDRMHALPPWCSDVPEFGTLIAAGEPICCVHASGHSSEQAARELRERRRFAEMRFSAEAAQWTP
jgi:predicted ATP-grasp superfamily ATP-dependent carboligase